MLFNGVDVLVNCVAILKDVLAVHVHDILFKPILSLKHFVVCYSALDILLIFESTFAI